MAIKIITSMERLMQLAHELGKARLSGDPKRIEEAETAHEAYRQLVLRSDGCLSGLTRGELEDIKKG